jgi:hypothetical protein
VAARKGVHFSGSVARVGCLSMARRRCAGQERMLIYAQRRRRRVSREVGAESTCGMKVEAESLWLVVPPIGVVFPGRRWMKSSHQM